MVNRLLIMNLIFQISWYWIARLIIEKNDSWSFLISALAIIMWMFLFKPDFQIILQIFGLVVIGLVWDYFLYKIDILKFDGNFPLGMIAIWILFGSVMEVYVNLFKSKMYFGSFMTSIFAGFSYLVAEKMGVLKIANSSSIFLILIFWFFYFIFCMNVLTNSKGVEDGN